MSEIVAIVEGETEQIFIRDQLAAHLGNLGISIWAVLSGKTRRHGGVKKWELARSDILRTLKEGRYCTTMFDYYAMPQDWPGRAFASGLPWQQRASHVEAEILKDISTAVGSDLHPAQFMPHVQLHEFEALLFANTEILAAASTAICGLSEQYLRNEFEKILAAAGHPEAINDGYETCPSRRITRIVHGFRKRTHSPIVAQRIGMDELIADCPHFNGWVRKLESVKPLK
jgi:hypothetical protein